ncbi:MAG: DJ-1/PfpI family protein [Candidatus Nealsonbacteria bacterium]
MKKIAIVLSFRDFQDIEYFIPKAVFKRAGVSISNVSSEKGTAFGVDGGEVKIDFEVLNFDISLFDAAVFVGGPGMGEKLEDKYFQDIAREALEKDKVLGAICIAPVLLAKAGVLAGKKATVWSSPLDKFPVRILEKEGAFYQKEGVVTDGKIITAAGPPFAAQFAEEVLRVLTSN